MTDDLKPWQIAYRLGRAGVRLDSKHTADGLVMAIYKHRTRSYRIAAYIRCRAHEVGRR